MARTLLQFLARPGWEKLVIPAAAAGGGEIGLSLFIGTKRRSMDA